MRTITSRGDHAVTVEVDGDSPKLLRQAEETASRLLGDPLPKRERQSFGFTAVFGGRS